MAHGAWRMGSRWHVAHIFTDAKMPQSSGSLSNERVGSTIRSKPYRFAMSMIESCGWPLNVLRMSSVYLVAQKPLHAAAAADATGPSGLKPLARHVGGLRRSFYHGLGAGRSRGHVGRDGWSHGRQDAGIRAQRTTGRLQTGGVY